MIKTIRLLYMIWKAKGKLRAAYGTKGGYLVVDHRYFQMIIKSRLCHKKISHISSITGDDEDDYDYYLWEMRVVKDEQVPPDTAYLLSEIFE